MTLAIHADAGQPLPIDIIARSEIRFFRFESPVRQISLRNTGPNTLWLSFDRHAWFDVASGTSWDDRVVARERRVAGMPTERTRGFWHCTQTGWTAIDGYGLALNNVTQPADPDVGSQE